MTIRYDELAKLYGQYAAVVREAEDGFRQSVGKMLDVVRDVASNIAGETIKEKFTGEGRAYRYWALQSFDKPHVWFWTRDVRIVCPGELRLRVWAGANPSDKVVAGVMRIAAQEEIGPVVEEPVPQTLFSVLYESGDGQPMEQLAGKVAELLSLLRDAG
jgi:hypothetical protein